MPKLKDDQEDPATASTVELAELEDSVGFHLRIAQTASFQAFAQQAGEMRLRPGLFAVLTVIGANPGLTQTALSRANGRDKSSLTPVLDNLVRRGLVKRRRVRDNRRAYSLELTAEGESARLRLLEAARRHEDSIAQILGKTKYDQLVHLLKSVAAGLVD